MLATVAAKSCRGRRHSSGASSGGATEALASAGRASGAEAVSKGSGEPIELEGEVGIEGSEIGVEEKATARPTHVSMDLDRRSLKAQRRKIATKGVCVVGVSTHRDASRTARGDEGLAGDRLDLRGRDGQGFADETFGHEAGELRRSVEVALVTRFLLGPKLDPAGRELGEAGPSPLVARLVSDRASARFGGRQDRARLVLGSGNDARRLHRC